MSLNCINLFDLLHIQQHFSSTETEYRHLLLVVSSSPSGKHIGSTFFCHAHLYIALKKHQEATYVIELHMNTIVSSLGKKKLQQDWRNESVLGESILTMSSSSPPESSLESSIT